jgi:hypothetical protein
MPIDKKEAALAIGDFLRKEFMAVAKAYFSTIVGLVKGKPISYSLNAYRELNDTGDRGLDRIQAAFIPKTPS